MPLATTTERGTITPDAGEMIYDETSSDVYIGDGSTTGGVKLVSGGTLPSGGTSGQLLSKVDSTDFNATWADALAVTFETVSKNLSSWDATLNYTTGTLTSVVYTDGVDTITKTLNYTTGTLTSVVLSGDTPLGIDLTKTLTYTGSDLTGIAYS